VFYANGWEAVCYPATELEEQAMNERDPLAQLRVITPPRGGLAPQAGGAMQIVLRGTPQLDQFPEAKAAFLRAAATWEGLLQAPITVIIDVDFGPTRFGQPFPPLVLGSTATQTLGNNNGYPDVRDALIASANSAEELDLYNSLPQGTVPTDLGNTPGFVAPSANLRALGLINAVADPDNEPQFGPPPSIGFNSNFLFDFNPDDGIDADKLDFDATAVHEIGHALGFSSRVGAKELNPAGDLVLSVWDLFRFRPGAGPAPIAPENLTSANRVLSSGGEQVFFADGPEISLSTGRPDGTGGDGFQASHWKDSSFVGNPIGVMDPAIASGERAVITQADLAALDAIGYGADQADLGAPNLKKASINSTGKLIIKGSGFSKENIEIEVNFVIISPPLKAKVKGSGAKIKIGGSMAELNLHAGANQVRVIQNGLRSNIFILNL
jgi:hypothetical protein